MDRRDFIKGALASLVAPTALAWGNENQLNLFEPNTRASIFDFELNPYQQEMLDIMSNDDRVMIATPRQMGKSTLMTMYALEMMIKNPITNILWFNGGRRGYASIIMDHLVMSKCIVHPINGRIPVNIPTGTEYVVNNKHQKVFTNGSRISYCHNDVSEYCSESADMVVFDEAAFIPNLNELYLSAQPVLSSKVDNKLVMISTPKEGSFFNAKFKSDNVDGVTRSRICYNPIPPRFSKQLMSDNWEQEILAEIV